MNIRIVGYGLAVAAVAAFFTAERVASQSGARSAVASASAQLVDDLVVGNRILANENILDGLGHISVRHDQNPNHFLLSRDLAPELVTGADLIEYDLDGNSVSDKRQGYQERFIHAAIYKARPDVRSVVHAHTPSLLVFADSLPETGDFFGGRDHTTVLHACRVVAELRGADPRTREDWDKLLRALTG